MPRIRNSEGIIIKIAPKGETSLIVHVFSNEWGKVALIAKGARQPKSHLRGILEPFSQVNFHFSEIRDRPWQFLTQAEFINPMTHLKNSSEAILYGSVLLEIIYRSQENHGDPNVYRLLKEALNAMNCGISPLPVHWAFILKYCQFQGAPLNLQTCYSCGKALEKAYFHPYEGFNYCGICSGQKGLSWELPADCHLLLTRLENTNFDDLKHIDYGGRHHNFINRILWNTVACRFDACRVLKSVNTLRKVL